MRPQATGPAAAVAHPRLVACLLWLLCSTPHVYRRPAQCLCVHLPSPPGHAPHAGTCRCMPQSPMTWTTLPPRWTGSAASWEGRACAAPAVAAACCWIWPRSGGSEECKQACACLARMDCLNSIHAWTVCVKSTRDCSWCEVVLSNVYSIMEMGRCYQNQQVAARCGGGITAGSAETGSPGRTWPPVGHGRRGGR